MRPDPAIFVASHAHGVHDKFVIVAGGPEFSSVPEDECALLYFRAHLVLIFSSFYICQFFCVFKSLTLS